MIVKTISGVGNLQQIQFVIDLLKQEAKPNEEIEITVIFSDRIEEN